jgi:glutamyl-tRNA synthetase
LSQTPPNKSPQAIRFKTPEAHVEFKDMIRGTLSFDAALFGDMVIAKSLDQVLYNFAVVVDDYEMRISHVIRGEDHISNTPKQILFMKALGFKEPLYAHLPLLLGPDRSKLSKRTAEASFLSYKDLGYLPEAMVNFLAFLGWHPKGDKEVLTPDELIKEFDIKRVQKAGAICNFEKLDWFNSQHIRRIPIVELGKMLQPLLETNHITADEGFLLKVLTVERERMTTLNDFIDNARFFFELPTYSATLLVWNNQPIAQIKSVLTTIVTYIEPLPMINEEKMREALAPLIEAEGRGAVFWPLRVALSGQAASPDPIVIGEVLGKEETLRRLAAALQKIDAI